MTRKILMKNKISLEIIIKILWRKITVEGKLIET